MERMDFNDLDVMRVWDVQKRTGIDRMQNRFNVVILRDENSKKRCIPRMHHLCTAIVYDCNDAILPERVMFQVFAQLGANMICFWRTNLVTVDLYVWHGAPPLQFVVNGTGFIVHIFVCKVKY